MLRNGFLGIIGVAHMLMVLGCKDDESKPMFPKNGLVAHYKFKAGSLSDFSGNGNVAVNSGAESTTDRFGKSTEAMVFDNVSDYLKVSSPSFLTNTSGAFVAWVKFSAVDHTQYVASVGDEGSTDSYLSFLRLDGTSKVLSIYQREVGLANWVEGSTVINSDEYYFLVMQSDGEEWSIYINGVKETLSVRGGSNTGKWIGDLTSIDNFVIGSSILLQPYTVPNLTGYVDEVLLYDRIFTENEIEEMYFDSMP